MEPKQFAEELIKKVTGLADDIELCIGTGKSLKYSVKNEDIEPSLSLDKSSVGIRVLKNGEIGYGAITRLNVDEAMMAVKKALGDTRPTILKKFAEIKNLPQVNNYDPEVLKLFDNPSFLRGIAEEMRDRLYNEANDVGSFLGGVSIVYSERLVATTNGMAFSQGTAFSAFAVLNSIDFDSRVSFDKPADFEEIKNLAVEVYRNLPKEMVTPVELGVAGKEVEVIIDPECLEEILSNVFTEKVYASSKMIGLSELSEGDIVADKKLTIIDTGIKQGLLSSSSTDDEGTASQENMIIENGVFKTFLYDVISALKAGKKPTGSGMRRPLLAEDDIEAPVRDSLRAFYIPPGEKPLAEMISGIKKGAYIKAMLGLHTADKIRAAFAVGVYSGKSIEDGKYKRILTPGTWNVSANIFDLDGKPGMLRDIELSRETFNTGSAILPWMKVKLRVKGN